MGGEGFEPSKALPADLQSVPFGHSGIHPCYKWDLQGSNLWPPACKADALPAELRSHIQKFILNFNDPRGTWTLDLRRDRAAL